MAANAKDTSIWKKEISFRRKKDLAAASLATPHDPEATLVGLASPAAAAVPRPEPVTKAVQDPDMPPVSPRLQVPLAGHDPTAPPPEPALSMPPPAVPSADAEVTVVGGPAFRLEGSPEPVSATVPAAAPPAAAQAAQPLPGLTAPDAKSAGRGVRRKPADSREHGVKRHRVLVGLRVDASGISAAEVVNSGSPSVASFASDPLEPGIVVGGEVRRPDDLGLALKAFFKKHGLPRGPIRVGIANNRIGVRVVELANIKDPKQLGNAVRFRAQEVLPIPLEEAALDYRVLRESVNAEGEPVHRVLLVVAHRELVEGYATACQKAGLKLAGIDLEAFGLLRALAPQGGVGIDEDSALVAVSIGSDLATLAVSDGHVCEFSRVLEWGGGSLAAAVARVLGISEPEAEAACAELSLVEDRPGPPWLSAEDAVRARAAMRGEAQAFARDLVASLRFYQEQPDSLGIAEIVIAGVGSQTHGLDVELARLIGVRVRVGDGLSRAKPIRKAAKLTPTAAVTAAIGLGIED